MSQLPLAGCVALVTGASRGVGRGTAIALAKEGATVYTTGRSIDAADLPDNIVRLQCDHRDDEAVERVFAHIALRSGHLDILVNSAWGGYEHMVEAGKFTWGDRFWEQPRWRWSAMMDAGVRAAFVASQHAVRLMLPRQRGLIANVSFFSAQKHIGNVIYGVAKAATDKFTADAAYELKDQGVAVMSLYPGLVRTESVLAAKVFDLKDSESAEFLGRVLARVFVDRGRMRLSGNAWTVADLARRYDVVDVDGKRPPVLTLADV